MLNPRSRRRLALAGVAAVALAQGVAGAATNNPIRLTQPVQATKADQDPLRTYSGPFMAVDPSNDNHIVASFVDMRTRRCGLMRSTDAGQSWRRLDASPANASYPFCLSNNSNIFQGPLAFGRNGTLYYGLTGWDVQDRAAGSGGNVDIQVARSTDLGDTWQTTIVHNARGNEGEKVENNRPVGNIAVDSKSGSDDVVYISWQFSTPLLLAPNANPTRAVVAVSTNGGRTFADPVDIAAPVWADPANRQKAISSPTATTLAPGVTTTTIAKPDGSRAAQPDQAANLGGRNPALAVDNKGNAYALWFNTSANIAPSVINGEWVSRSSDNGKTWTAVQVGPMSPATGGIGRIAWSPQGGPQGTVHIVSQVNTTVTSDNTSGVSGSGDIAYKQSTDGGKTWSPQKIVNDDNPADMLGQYIPMISVAPNGRLDVAWWDTRSDPGIRGNDVYYSHSDDNGKTWSKNMRITDKTIDRKLGVWGNNFDMSSPPGIASTNAFAIFGWDDTRNSDVSSPANAGFGGGVQDIYTAAVQYKVLGGGTSTAVKSALAGVVGLLLVGLVLLAVSLGQRRRVGDSAPRSTVGGKAPAGVK
jgi:hypothetical protein